MIKLFIKFVVGVLIIPVGVGVTISFYNNLILVQELSKNLHFFIWGIVSYVVLHLLFYKPTFLYVFGHEAVHAGMSWVMGGRIKSFKATAEGGEVATDKSNFIIELGPYFVPVYAILITVIYFVIAQSYRVNGAAFVFLIGFALALHMISTIEVLKVRQPDIVKSGYFFSIVLIWALNIIVISLMFGLIFPSFELKKFFLESWLLSKGMYAAIIRQLFL